MKPTVPLPYWLALGLMVLETGYVLWNVALDLIIRILPSSHQYLDPDLVAFIRSVSWFQDTVFFLAAAAACVAVWLFLGRSVWVLAAYGAQVFLSKADWLMSGFNGVEMFTTQGYISLTYQTVVMGLLIWLSYRETLD
ncbi:hypothetical protein [Maricaulis sp.]|uniref:hypothetical protein n=1 Tax=Maricaulis sp. TaxID=1486257 RepID=UPI002B266EB2|nr:hypothetical protein [Maricaulis sp.]